jgi:hypothetical protein
MGSALLGEGLGGLQDVRGWRGRYVLLVALAGAGADQLARVAVVVVVMLVDEAVMLLLLAGTGVDPLTRDVVDVVVVNVRHRGFSLNHFLWKLYRIEGA